jgi:hypothetical protein
LPASAHLHPCWFPFYSSSHTWRILVLSTSTSVEEEERRPEALVVAGEAMALGGRGVESGWQ